MPDQHLRNILGDDFYPLKGSPFDVSSQQAYALSPDARVQFVAGLLRALRQEDQRGRLRLKKTPKFRDEMRELRRLVRWRTDTHLALDERQWKRNVLSRPSPAHSIHTTHAATAMVRMGTSFGHVPTKLKQAVAWLDANDTTAQPLTEARFQQHRKKKQVPELFTRIYRLLDVDDATKAAYRNYTNEVLREIYGHLLQHYNLRSAFPPYHARFLVDYYAPKTGPVTVLDPCAGWGGRLLGTLAIPRTDKVRYVGTDPNRDVQSAYERLTYRITHYLRNEKALGNREASVAPLPFEDWLKTKAAAALRGKVDVAITSPPYGIGTEIYQLEEDTPKQQKTQSANRYTTYEAWIDGFLRPMCNGVAAMLKPGGVFILNIANVREKAPRLEDHANALLKDTGLVREKDLWKLAMARAVGTQAKDPKHTVIVDGVAYRYEPCFVWRKPEGWTPRRGTGVVIWAPQRRKKTSAPKTAPPKSLAGTDAYHAPDGTTYSVNDLSQLVKSWRPSPQPRVETHGKVLVVRDDELPYGSKMRCLDALVGAHPDITEFVYGSVSATGLGGIALADACQRHKKRCVLFMAKRSLSALTPHQREIRRLGAVIKWVPSGMLSVTEKRARDYVAKDTRRLLLPLGLEHPVVVAAMMKTALSLKLSPKVVVTSASSGTLNRALQLAFPKAKVVMVTSGHSPDERQQGRAVIVPSPFPKRVPDNQLPPFPSVATWDAMAWVVSQKHKPCLFWNIGTDERLSE